MIQEIVLLVCQNLKCNAMYYLTDMQAQRKTNSTAGTDVPGIH